MDTILPAVDLNILTKLEFDQPTNTLRYTDEFGGVTNIPLRLTIQSGPNSPVGTIVPTGPDEPYNQIAADRVVQWISTGTTNTDWRAIGGTAIVSTNFPNETPAYSGQIWIVVTIASDGSLTETRTYAGIDPNGPPNTGNWEII